MLVPVDYYWAPEDTPREFSSSTLPLPCGALPSPGCWSQLLPLPSRSQGCVCWPSPPQPSCRPVAHQGDEVGEGELQADIDHVRIALGWPQVRVVVEHQV